MSEHVWKIGDWAELYDTRCLVFYVTEDCCWVVKQVPRWGDDQREDTRMPLKNNPELKHLPDCTGWDWQPPKLQLREGAWYERADGKVVGPSRYISCSDRYHVGDHYYHISGIATVADGCDIIREVPAPAPKYRPFANAAEFKPHRDRWLVNKGGKLVGRVCGYDETDCYFIGPIGNGYSGTWEKCFGHVVFDDTKLPFGVEVTE